MTSSQDRKTHGLVWFDEPTPQRATEQLSRKRVVAAAIELADEKASGEITMRAIAARIGTRSPMAIYRYVGSKDGLADLMTDEIYGQINVVRGQGWREGLSELGRSGWDAVRRHPWFARLAFSRPPFGPNALNVYDAALAELEPLGLDATTRMGFINTVLGHVFGSGLALLEENAMRAKVGFTSDKDLESAAASYIERIAAAGKHPHFIRWATDPERDSAEPQPFEQVLEWLLDGLATIPTRD